MKVQVNTDQTVEGSSELAREASAIVDAGLTRFSERITRVEIHLSDVNGVRFGVDDKRCLLEARLAGLRPLAVSHQAGTLEAAVSGATQKLTRTLESTLGRLDRRQGRPTVELS
jgi:hypothetical protein